MKEVNKKRVRTEQWALRKAREHGRKVIWKDDDGNWQAALNWDNTPRFAVEAKEVV